MVVENSPASNRVFLFSKKHGCFKRLRGYRVVLKNLHAIMWARNFSKFYQKLWQLRTAPTTSKPWCRLTLLGWRDLEPIQRDNANKGQWKISGIGTFGMPKYPLHFLTPKSSENRPIFLPKFQLSFVCHFLVWKKNLGKPGKPTSRT